MESSLGESMIQIFLFFFHPLAPSPSQLSFRSVAAGLHVTCVTKDGCYLASQIVQSLSPLSLLSPISLSQGSISRGQVYPFEDISKDQAPFCTWEELAQAVAGRQQCLPTVSLSLPHIRCIGNR